MKNVIIYSTPTCTYCKHAKDYMTSKGVAYTEYNVAADTDRRKEMVDKSGQLGVPVIDVEGKIIIGFEESELAEALEIK
jgi:glutaredoxin 3